LPDEREHRAGGSEGKPVAAIACAFPKAIILGMMLLERFTVS